MHRPCFADDESHPLESGRTAAGAADDQEHGLATRTEILISLFAPVLILAMDGLVLLIVPAMLPPVFEMNQLVV